MRVRMMVGLERKDGGARGTQSRIYKEVEEDGTHGDAFE